MKSLSGRPVRLLGLLLFGIYEESVRFGVAVEILEYCCDIENCAGNVVWCLITRLMGLIFDLDAALGICGYGFGGL